MLRKVVDIIEPAYVQEGAGVLLRRSIATPRLDYLDPFLLFDHFGSDDPRDYLAGFPMHPHRGIETVTYMLGGNINHKDSLGNQGTIGKRDVQWMTSGSGIMHEEMPQKPETGKMEGFQLWVNLPARLKMTSPRYQEVKAADIPEVEHKGVRVKVIAGEYEGVKGPVNEIYADPEYLDVYIPSGGEFKQFITPGHNAFIYLYEGKGMFSGKEVSSTRLLVLGGGDHIQVESKEDMRFLLISGKPLNEPIARHGPFVMNTREEIMEALDDLTKGTFVK
ncbi:MAG: pirin family protein [Methanobacteriaceae archaeon]|jgi:redox-sensitive bicupin YhaK (pirin superfamily)|nr:pirin family protein [Methanobacteriaceae archaeon]